MNEELNKIIFFPLQLFDLLYTIACYFSQFQFNANENRIEIVEQEEKKINCGDGDKNCSQTRKCKKDEEREKNIYLIRRWI